MNKSFIQTWNKKSDNEKWSELTRICINIYHQNNLETTYLKKEIYRNIYKQAAK